MDFACTICPGMPLQISVRQGNLGEADILIKSCSKSGVWASIRGVTRLIRLTNQNLRVQVAEDVDLSELIKKQEMIKGLVEDGDGNLWITTWNNIYVKSVLMFGT